MVYAYSNFTMNCKGLITVSNQQQTSESNIILNVISWSSKRCIKWFGPYQNQCTEWESNCILDESGMCLRDMKYSFISKSNFL